MVFPATSLFPQIPICSIDNPPGHGPFAVLTKSRSDEPVLIELAQQFGSNLVVPEIWRNILPQAGVLISSAISGGTMNERVQEAAAANPRRCWLMLEPMATEFPLPCPDGIGKEITITDYGNSFYSEALCCMYTHFATEQRAGFIVWDTEQTLLRKMELAKNAGFLGFVPHPSCMFFG